jgi:hypothetical protein
MTRQHHGYGSYKSYKPKRKITIGVRLHTIPSLPFNLRSCSQSDPRNSPWVTDVQPTPLPLQTRIPAREKTLTHIVGSSMTGGSNSKPCNAKRISVPFCFPLRQNPHIYRMRRISGVIKDVCSRHRIWPKERPDRKPALDSVMSQAQLEKKVADYESKSQALEDYWQRPLLVSSYKLKWSAWQSTPIRQRYYANSLMHSVMILLSSRNVWPGRY